MLNTERRWKGFKYLFDEEKFIPSVVAIATFYLKVYELELRCSNPYQWDSNSKALREILVGRAICDSGTLALADSPSTMTTSLRVELQADEEYLARKEVHLLRTGNEEDLDPEVNATISYHPQGEGNQDDMWYLSIYLSNAQFAALRNHVLGRSVRDITVGLKSDETLTNAFNECYSDSRHLNWFLPQDEAGKPISAGCSTSVFSFSAGGSWPPLPTNEMQDDELKESHAAEGDAPKADTDDLTYIPMGQLDKVIDLVRRINRFLLAITVLVFIFGVAILLG